MTQSNSQRIFIKFQTYLSLGLLVAAVLPVTVLAASQYFYPAKASVQSGMLVSLSANPEVVEASSNANSKNLVGVVAAGAVNAFSDVKPGQIAVATDGVAQTLVSTAGGDIRVGDKIKASSVIGAGQKAGDNGWIVGIAQGSFDAKTKGAVRQTFDVTGSKGLDVYVGTIPVLIKVTYVGNPNADAATSTVVPAAIQKAANAIAGRQVSAAAIMASIVLLLITFAIAGFVINSSVRGSFVAIGRNPLTKAVVIRGLLLTFAVAIGLVVAGMVVTVILLRTL